MSRSRRRSTAPRIAAAVLFIWVGAATAIATPQGGEIPDQGQASGAEAVARLRSAYATTSDGAARERLLKEAAGRGGPEAVRWLAEVAEGDDRLGAHAAAALGTVADPRAAPELRSLSQREDGAVLVRANAVKALGVAGSPEDGGLLLGLLADPRQALRVRQESAASLAKLGGAEAAGPLSAALDALAGQAGPESEQLRISVIKALDGLAVPASRDALRRHASRELPPTERVFLEQALARAN